MKKFQYTALAFRQQATAPIQVAFVAHAAEILEWAGVPRKSDEFLTGYQRFRDIQRINQEIVPFFQNPQNCSPTSLVLALHKDAGPGRCTLEPAEIEPGSIVQATLTVEFDDDIFNSDKIFDIAKQVLATRLQQESVRPSPQAAEESEDDDDDDNVEIDGDAEDPDFASDGAVNLGNVTVQRIFELLDEPTNRENPAFRAAIADVLRPGLIIDGQHRATAAGKIGPTGLPFLVCGLFGASWEEQVFQFTVINLRPRKIAPALVTSIAGLSLTSAEQRRVKSRLSQAGVKMAEVTIMSLVAYDDRSPFEGIVDMAVTAPKERPNLLGYGAVKRIAREWWSCNRMSFINIAKNLFSTTSVATARSRWRTESAWFDMFCVFWNSVRDKYGEDLWVKKDGNKLMIGANLWALQEALLQEADGMPVRLWSIPDSIAEYTERLRELGKVLTTETVAAFLSSLPREIWTVAWVKQSMDTKQGREDVLKKLQEFIQYGKKHGSVWRSWKQDPWFSSPGKESGNASG